MKTFLKIELTLIFSLIFSTTVFSKKKIEYVNNFVGTSFTGHTFPGVALPFSMIQPGPDTGVSDWDHCSGYVWEDKRIIGFSQVHLCGIGCMSGGDLLIQPFSGNPNRKDFTSAFEKKFEVAHPGYYAVKLKENEVDVQITATQRVAFYKFTYNSNNANLLIDTQSGIVRPEQKVYRIIDGELNFIDEYTITGYIYAKEWAKKRIYFAISFDTPYTSKQILEKQDPRENGTRVIVSFNRKKGEAVQSKIAISSTSIDGARKNLLADPYGWDFKKALSCAENTWEKELNVLEASGTEEQKKVYYTALYHLLTQPTNMSDVDGKFRGIDDKVDKLANNQSYFTNLSLWDTYRATHPLYTIIAPEIVNDVVSSMIDHSQKQGYLPIWPLWGQETYCMIGNHAIPVIVEAYLKGFKGFDIQKAYQAIRETSFIENAKNKKSPWVVYEKYGYYPMDIVRFESVSRTLETAYDDYCGSILANSLGFTDDYQRFIKRTNFIYNLYDSKSGFFRGKDSHGNWETPFDPLRACHGSNGHGSFTEGNGWQYLWHVQHDTPAFIQLLGGKEKFTQKLDSLFNQASVVYGDGRTAEITGLIGQYAHGNEPSHHVPYFWSFTKKSWRGAEIIRELITTEYKNAPDGLCGNEDMGQMSAWYIFSVMGFYPLNPVTGEYVFGAPQLPKVTINLTNGKKFTVIAQNLSESNKYVKSIRLNGKPYPKNYISHRDIIDGGELVFEMTNEKISLWN